MKTSKLIELLQKADPSGECEVCIDNQDILPYMYPEPGYWDGRLQVITEWNKNTPLTTTISSSPSKIKLHYLDLTDHYVESIMYNQTEYQIKTENDRFSSDWTRWAYWKIDKLQWIVNFYEYKRKYKDLEQNHQSVLDLCESIKQQILADGRNKFKQYTTRNSEIPSKCIEKLLVVAEFIWSKGDYILEPYALGTKYIVTRIANKYQPTIKVTFDGNCKIVTENRISDPDRVGFSKKLEDTETNYELYDWDTFRQEYQNRLGADK